MKRENGFYWVRVEDKWNVCFYDSSDGSWLVPGTDIYLGDQDFTEIDERRIERIED